MHIIFYIECETETFVWTHAVDIPRVGDKLMYDNSMFIVKEVIWSSKDMLAITIERL